MERVPVVNHSPDDTIDVVADPFLLPLPVVDENLAILDFAVQPDDTGGNIPVVLLLQFEGQAIDGRDIHSAVLAAHRVGRPLQRLAEDEGVGRDGRATGSDLKGVLGRSRRDPAVDPGSGDRALPDFLPIPGVYHDDLLAVLEDGAVEFDDTGGLVHFVGLFDLKILAIGIYNLHRPVMAR